MKRGEWRKRRLLWILLVACCVSLTLSGVGIPNDAVFDPSRMNQLELDRDRSNDRDRLRAYSRNTVHDENGVQGKRILSGTRRSTELTAAITPSRVQLTNGKVYEGRIMRLDDNQVYMRIYEGAGELTFAAPRSHIHHVVPAGTEVVQRIAELKTQEQALQQNLAIATGNSLPFVGGCLGQCGFLNGKQNGVYGGGQVCGDDFRQVLRGDFVDSENLEGIAELKHLQCKRLKLGWQLYWEWFVYLELLDDSYREILVGTACLELGHGDSLEAARLSQRLLVRMFGNRQTEPTQEGDKVLLEKHSGFYSQTSQPEKHRALLQDVLLAALYKQGIVGEAEKLAKQWVATRYPDQSGGLGFWLLADIAYQAGNYEDALWRVLEALLYEWQGPNAFLLECYAVGIAAEGQLDEWNTVTVLLENLAYVLTDIGWGRHETGEADAGHAFVILNEQFPLYRDAFQRISARSEILNAQLTVADARQRIERRRK